MRDFLRHGALVFTGLIAANVLTYVFYAAVTRAVGVETAGLFTSLISAMLVLALPGTVAATIVGKLVADAAAAGDASLPAALARRIARSAVPAAVATGLAVLVGAAPIAGFFHTRDPIVIGLAAAGFVVTLLLAPQRAVLQGRSDFRGLSASNVLEGVGKALTGIAVLRARGGLRWALAGYLLAVGAACALNLRLTVRAPFAALPVTRAGALRHLVRIALPIAAITAMTFIDVVLARHFLTPREAGLYGAAALAGRAMLTVIAFVPTVLLPKAAARVRAGANPAGLLGVALAVTVVAVGAMLVGVDRVPRLIVTTLAGPAFAAADALLPTYALAMAALAGTAVLATYLIGIDRHAFALPLAVVALAEIGAICVWHADAAALLATILAGHAAGFACCLGDTLVSLRPRSMPLPVGDRR